VDVTGCDVSPVALQRARVLTASAGISEAATETTTDATSAAASPGATGPRGLQWARCDVLDPAGGLPRLAAAHDVVISSLFLHHLEDDQVVTLLSTLARARPRLVLIDDLRRSRWGLALAFCASHLLSRSPVVHHDALVSVARAFRPSEVAALATCAGLAVRAESAPVPRAVQACQIKAPDRRRIRGFVEVRQRRAGASGPSTGADDFSHGLLERVVLRRRWPARFQLLWKPSG
jgi:hypothetical protein